MIETTVSFRGGVRFVANSRGHEVLCDQPAEGGGEDTGMTPPELMLASLGTCAGYYVVQYLKFRSLPTDGLTVRVEAEKAQQPARLGLFRIVISHAGVSDPMHVANMHRAAEKCLIHNTLLHVPEVQIVVNPLPSNCEPIAAT